jgi:hypothetical protein
LNTTPDQGRRYYLSAMLGVAWYLGNSEAEILASLQRSRDADGARPAGTFYFTRTEDPRTRVRRPNVAVAANQLRQHGFQADVIATPLPLSATVAGGMFGSANYDWPSSDSTIAPGAYCDNLTGYSASFTMTGQMKLTEMIRRGAAGSSGTVSESYDAVERAPDPMLFLHYVRGCTLGEAFYQAVWGPSQILLVGDPLCRPWARPIRLTLPEDEAIRTVRGSVAFPLQVDDPDVTSVSLYIDDRHYGQRAPGERVVLDTGRLSDGYHELRVVARSPRLDRSPGRAVIPFWVDNGGGGVELSVNEGPLTWQDQIEVRARSALPGRLILRHNARDLAVQAGPEATFLIAAADLGRGPVRLHGVVRDERNREVASRPLRLTIEGPVAESPLDPLAEEHEAQRRRDEEEMKRQQERRSQPAGGGR